MNTLIENTLISNLARMFTAYGWVGKSTPTTLKDKEDTIAYGLYHGDAMAYYTHLSLLIAAHEKDNQWGIFTPTTVQSTCSILKVFCEKKGLFEIKSSKPAPVFNTPISDKNIFKHTKRGKDALLRLKTFGNTVIEYDFVHDYGVERILKDLKKVAGSKATVRVCEESFVPSSIWELAYDPDTDKLPLYHPFYPAVVISNGLR